MCDQTTTTTTEEAFRRAAWSWLAPPERLARARMLMQLAYVANFDAEACVAPPLLDRYGLEVHDAHGFVEHRDPTAEELARAGDLWEHGRRLGEEARRLCSRVAGIDDAMADVFERARVEWRAAERRDLAERLIADFIYEGGLVFGDTVTVGSYRTATSTGPTFATLNMLGALVGAQGEPRAWTLNDPDPEWTATRAAALFVAAEGPDAALAALADRRRVDS